MVFFLPPPSFSFSSVLLLLVVKLQLCLFFYQECYVLVRCNATTSIGKVITAMLLVWFKLGSLCLVCLFVYFVFVVLFLFDHVVEFCLCFVRLVERE